jgi:hypothetical protein
MCPHTPTYVSSCYYMWPHATMCVLMLLCVSTYYYIYVRMLLCMCPHATTYVSSYHCICVLVLLYIYPHVSIYFRMIEIAVWGHAYGADLASLPLYVSVSYLCMRPSATSVRGLKLLVYEALSY